MEHERKRVEGGVHREKDTVGGESWKRMEGRQSRGGKGEKNSVGREKWDVNREHRGGGVFGEGGCT